MGPEKTSDTVRGVLEKEGLKCALLDIPYAFHTAQMDVVLDAFENLAAHVPFKAPSVPVISPLLGSSVYDGKTINANYLRRATRETVNFAAAVDAAVDLATVDDKAVWVDIGPHPICAPYIRSLVPGSSVVASCRHNEHGVTTIAKSLATLHPWLACPCAGASISGRTRKHTPCFISTNTAGPKPTTGPRISARGHWTRPVSSTRGARAS